MTDHQLAGLNEGDHYYITAAGREFMQYEREMDLLIRAVVDWAEAKPEDEETCRQYVYRRQEAVTEAVMKHGQAMARAASEGGAP